MASSSRRSGTPTSHHHPHSSSHTKAIVQYTADACLHAVFKQSGESGKSFNYSQSMKTGLQSVPEQQITAYLSRIQRGGHIQPFECLIAVDESSFRVLASPLAARERASEWGLS